MDKTKKTPFGKVAFFAALWAVTYAFCLVVIKKAALGTTAGIIVSLLPLLAFALFIYSFIKGLASADEVEARIQMEAAVIAFSLGLLLIMTLGLLDLVVVLDKENWGYRHLVPYFAIFYFIGLFISKRKYMGNEKHD